MKWFLLSVLLPCICPGQELSRTPVTTDELVIEVKGDSREVAYTNKSAGVFYTETGAGHRNAWQGWRVMSREIMEDYSIEIDDQPLNRSDIVSTLVYPDRMTRVYANGLRETLTMLDSVNAIIIELDSVKGQRVQMRPLYSDLHSADDFILKTEYGVIVTVRKDHPLPTPADPSPGAIAVTMNPGKNFALSYYEPKMVGKNFSPGALRSGATGTNYAIVVTAGESAKDAFDLANTIINHYPDYLDKRKARIEQMLNRSYVRTDNARFDKALNWAKASLDALIMNQRGKGIFAGLPWFDNYWGRDSYVSLPGATLVTGGFDDAREILRSFAAWQDTNEHSPNYGRIPNQVTTSSISYNTADGTPRFVIALGEYEKYSGDTAFARQMEPVVRRSVEGTLRYHTDSLYFLTHGDAETWMDAVGPGGTWSPRGNRANDVQALWFRQLQTAASLSGDPAFRAKWLGIAGRLAANFQKYFIDTSAGLVYDHLNADGTPDRQLRPNQLFTFDLIRDETIRQRMLGTVTGSLVYPYGVASLSQDDENFHPYHHYSPYYVQDAAYHNGIVWTWLAGQWIDCLTNYGLADTAFRVTETMAGQILDRGAAGTFSELLDAAPRPGEQVPRLSGAFSQAWSLAEYIRSFYQSYLGVKIFTVPSTGERGIALFPNLPDSITHAHFVVPIGPVRFDCDYQISGRAGVIAISAASQTKAMPMKLILNGKNGKLESASFSMPPNDTVKLTIGNSGVTGTAGKSQLELTMADEASSPHAPLSPKDVKLAIPRVRPDLKSLKPPDHRLLTNADIKQPADSAKTLYDAGDPEGDDTGAGGYTYPLTSNLKPGSFDMTHFTVSANRRNVYFRLQFKELSNPGWHPEYGFQLTYAAIAIDKDRKPGSGRTKVGMNSQYTLKQEYACEDIIFIGGGVQVQNEKGKILAEYLPVGGDENNPLGSVETKTIQFAIPIEIIGKPLPAWRYIVLAGGQDDHGGAGIGDFRSVETTAKEWVGGGKKISADPNVYDVILPQSKR